VCLQLGPYDNVVFDKLNTRLVADKMLSAPKACKAWGIGGLMKKSIVAYITVDLK